MKQGIHPEYKPATIVCSCGNQIETRSTQDEIHVEICSVCHPFYTGKQRLVDTAGRVERFQRKYGTVEERKQQAEEEAAEEKAARKEAAAAAEKAAAEKPAAAAGEAAARKGEAEEGESADAATEAPEPRPMPTRPGGESEEAGEDAG